MAEADAGGDAGVVEEGAVSQGMAELNLGKIAWKHAILNNASDDAREAMSAQLKAWRHPLDCRRKDDNRQKALKWFTGEKWHSFCAGTSGSPGGPVAIAMLTLIMAEDMQLNGIGTAAAAPVAAAPVAAPPRGRGRGICSPLVAQPSPPSPPLPSLPHVPRSSTSRLHLSLPRTPPTLPLFGSCTAPGPRP